MALFAIMIASDAQLAPALEAAYPQKYLQVGPGQWLVASSGTAIDVSTALGITGGRNGGGVVVSVSGYYGRASTGIWEWIKANWAS